MLYQKIESLFKRDKYTFKFITPFKLTNEIFSLIKEWDWTEKVDGTNIRILYGVDYFSYLSVNYSDYESIFIGGRTNNAKIPPGVEKYIRNIISVEKIKEIFGKKSVIIYGEGYGKNIQSCGASYSPVQKFVAFDILVGNKYWLKREDVEQICFKLGIDCVPYIGRLNIQSASYLVKGGFTSRISKDVKSEGLIGRPPIPLFDAKHRRVICKLKTKDFQED
jgi:hypothetical protein